MGRSPCCEKAHTNKGAWTKEEDMLLTSYITLHGEGCWRSLPKAAGLQRCGKSCRLRWINYLRPDLKRGNFSEEEDGVIIKLHRQFGNKWSLIASHLPGRTDNEIKNYWNTHIKRKLADRGREELVVRVPDQLASTCSSSTQTDLVMARNCTPETPTSEPSAGTAAEVDVGLDLELSIGLPWYSHAPPGLAEKRAAVEQEKIGGHLGMDSGGSYPCVFRCYM